MKRNFVCSSRELNIVCLSRDVCCRGVRRRPPGMTVRIAVRSVQSAQRHFAKPYPTSASDTVARSGEACQR